MVIFHVVHEVVAWPSGLRRWFKAPVISMAWVQIPPLPEFFFIARDTYFIANTPTSSFIIFIYSCLLPHVQFECEYRRFNLNRMQLNQFEAFHALVKESHHLPSDMPFTISYTDPRNGDLLPINNDDNLVRAFTTAVPLLRVIVYRKQGKMVEWEKGGNRGEVEGEGSEKEKRGEGRLGRWNGEEEES